MGTPTPDVVIVGGGVIGCALAYALAGEGASVTVLERGLVGGEASGAAAGILAPRVHATGHPDLFALAQASQARFPMLVDAVRAETGFDAEYVRSGILDLALDEAAEETLRDKVRWLQGQGHAVAWLDARAALEREPALNPDLRGAFFDADAYHIHPARFTQALSQAAARRGVRFELGTEVVGIERQGARASAVRTATDRVAVGQVVLAAGAWTRTFAEWVGCEIPVYPVRGQILTVSAVPPPLRSIVCGAAAYVFPRVDGTVVVGATVEQVGFDKRLTASGLGWLFGVLPVLCPALAGATFDRAWTGLRPAGPDELPIVGRAPGWDNVVVATGHYRDGILLAPITAHLVAGLLLRGETGPLLAPLAPDRFVTA